MNNNIFIILLIILLSSIIKTKEIPHKGFTYNFNSHDSYKDSHFNGNSQSSNSQKLQKDVTSIHDKYSYGNSHDEHNVIAQHRLKPRFAQTSLKAKLHLELLKQRVINNKIKKYQKYRNQEFTPFTKLKTIHAINGLKSKEDVDSVHALRFKAVHKEIKKILDDQTYKTAPKTRKGPFKRILYQG